MAKLKTRIEEEKGQLEEDIALRIATTTDPL
jgi:hypothetical protein